MYMVSPTALRIRRLLRTKEQVGPFVVTTLLKVNAWAESIQASGPDLVSGKLPPSVPARHPMQRIAENLVEYAAGIEHQLLLKSLQEALLCCVGFDTDLTSRQIRARLKRFLDRHTKVAFLKRFLSLYFFNLVWFHTADSFRDQAVTFQRFENDMKQVEKICRRIVFGAYEHVDVLDESAAGELIRNIERRLRRPVMLVAVASNSFGHRARLQS
jgi:hypothetical protein